MKFNWGTGILIFIILFVSGIGLLVYISFQQKINLVYEDYYPKEIVHQEMIEKVKNTSRLTAKINITCGDDSIEVAFPDIFRYDKVTGSILLYRPSDFEKDLTFPIKLSETGAQNISVSGLLKGRYIVKVDWSYNDTGYYYEHSIHVK